MKQSRLAQVTYIQMIETRSNMLISKRQTRRYKNHVNLDSGVGRYFLYEIKCALWYTFYIKNESTSAINAVMLSVAVLHKNDIVFT